MALSCTAHFVPWPYWLDANLYSKRETNRGDDELVGHIGRSFILFYFELLQSETLVLKADFFSSNKITKLRPIKGIFVVTGLKASTKTNGNWIAAKTSSTDNRNIFKKFANFVL